MSRVQHRRLGALEALRPVSSPDQPWQAILREVPIPALNAMAALLIAHEANPTAPVVLEGCLLILRDFAPSTEPLDRWLTMLEAA